MGWQRAGDTSKHIAESKLALVGNALSFAIAIGAGMTLNPDAINVWATAPK